MVIVRRFLFAAALLFISQTIVAAQKLVLIGGGTRPPQAIEKFVKWTELKNPSVLIITWASQVPDEVFGDLKVDFANHKAQITHAANPKQSTQSRAEFLTQLKSADAVFFSGGDQNRIMDVLQDQTIEGALLQKYRDGIVFGGTSAGTAITAEVMMTGVFDPTVIDGAKVETGKGLGLLPNLIVDQHFIVRQRSHRLFGLMLNHPDKVGLGIDEGMAVAISSNESAEVFGPTQVMKVRATGNRLVLDLYKDKDTFLLK